MLWVSHLASSCCPRWPQGSRKSLTRVSSVWVCLKVQWVFFFCCRWTMFPMRYLGLTPVLWHSGAALAFYQTQTFIKNRTFMYYCKGMKRSAKKITPHASISHIEYCLPQSTTPRNGCSGLDFQTFITQLSEVLNTYPTTSFIHHLTQIPFFNPWKMIDPKKWLLSAVPLRSTHASSLSPTLQHTHSICDISLASACWKFQWG